MHRQRMRLLILLIAEKSLHAPVPALGGTCGAITDGEGGDTKAEENSWESQVICLAVVMMPKHPHATGRGCCGQKGQTS